LLFAALLLVAICLLIVSSSFGAPLDSGIERSFAHLAEPVGIVLQAAKLALVHGTELLNFVSARAPQATAAAHSGLPLAHHCLPLTRLALAHRVLLRGVRVLGPASCEQTGQCDGYEKFRRG
jgi:hypothetical protein